MTASLTPRELELLALTARGLPIKDIAHRMRVSAGRVSQISGRACHKLGARSRSHAAHIAAARGLIELPDGEAAAQ